MCFQTVGKVKLTLTGLGHVEQARGRLSVSALGCGGGSRVVRLLMLHSHHVCDDEMNWLMSA